MSPRNTQYSREEIIDAAFELARLQGWAGFSVPSVAKVIQSSTMPIYSKFANVRELEDAVVEKAFELLKERMLERVTGDVWIDQGITFLKFAVEEKHLYRCMWDGRNPELNRRLGIDLWVFIDRQLIGYPPFEGLDPYQYKMVRMSRSMLAQGLATALNMKRKIMEEFGMTMEEYIRDSSFAILEGFKAQFTAAKNGR